MAKGRFGGGSGTALDPYLVEDAADLNAIRNNRAAHYKQTANITLSGEWIPIGNVESLNNAPWTLSYPFTGAYDGDHYRISGLKVTTIRYDESGYEIGNSSLFGKVDGATLRNIRIIEPEISGVFDCGTLFGFSDACTIEDCRSIGGTCESDGAFGNDYVGGLGGEILYGSSMSRCYSTTDVSGSCAGGLLGEARDSTIDDCYSAGDVTDVGFIGGTHGMIGWLDGSYPGDPGDPPVVTNSFYDSDVSGYSDNDGHGVPKTTAQMKLEATFIDWDFVNDWVMPTNSYPVLIVTPPDPVAIGSPALARSAHPKVTFTCPDGHGTPLHFRVTSYADEGLTVQVAQADTSVLTNPFRYSNDGGLSWPFFPAAGLLEYGAIVRCEIEVGPLRQAWIKVDVGVEDYD